MRGLQVSLLLAPAGRLIYTCTNAIFTNAAKEPNPWKERLVKSRKNEQDN